MFFLRCAFWLSIVYGSMSWSGTALQQAGSLVAPAVAAAHVARAAASAGVPAACAGRELQCLKDASALTALVQKVVLDGEDAGRALRPDTDVDAPVPVPMPVPRPRGGKSPRTS